MKRRYIPLTFFLIMIFSAVTVSAEIRVLSVKGTAAYKEGGQWIPLKAGALLKEGAKVSTGVRSNVEIKINRHTMTVHPLTIVKISESRDDAKSSTTRVGLRRGSVRTMVTRDARIKTVFKVSTPVATSSVRGSGQITISGPTFGTRVIVLAPPVFGEGLNSGMKILSGDLQLLQKLSKGNPESIMTGVQDFITQTHSLFITLDEEKAYELFGDDFLVYEQPNKRSEGSVGVPVPVTIYLIWPQ